MNLDNVIYNFCNKIIPDIIKIEDKLKNINKLDLYFENEDLKSQLKYMKKDNDRLKNLVVLLLLCMSGIFIILLLI